MIRKLSAACALLLLFSAAAQAVTELDGQTPGGAFYAIAVPDAWNGTLVIWNHGYKDGLVTVENEKEYQDVVPADRLSTAIVVEPVPTHCGFTQAEVIAGWESLRGWLAGLPQPTAAGIRELCSLIEAGGLAAGPCRIDPGFVVPDMDTRVPPRRNAPPH